MPTTLIEQSTDPVLPLWLATESGLSALLQRLPPAQAAWARAQGYNAERHRLLLLPSGDGELAGAIGGLGAAAQIEDLSPWDAAAFAERLPPATYRLVDSFGGGNAIHAATQFALGWLLGGYRFTHCRGTAPKASAPSALLVPAGADSAYARAAATAMAWARDLINTPANLLGPAELSAATAQLVAQYGGSINVTRGADLTREYPLVAAVGGGSAREPLLIDARWPRPGAPRVRLVGKGVCFDSGGLDLKPSAGMLLMKKDMGGAACVLGLAQLLLEMRAPIDLRVLIPAVENSVGGRAYRPGDVWPSRKHLSVEIGNTDAEGRLVLADALTDADTEVPDLLVDLATLTGAARTALGPELPAVFSNDEDLAAELTRLGRAHADPVWPLPLWSGYDDELNSRIADLNNVSPSPFAGAIFGALFLRRFVTATPQWLHIDLFAWNPKERAGRPVGAEAHGVRAIYQLIRQRFG